MLLIVLMVSLLSYHFMYTSAQKLETIITVEETKLKRWHLLLETSSDAKNSLFDYYVGRSEIVTPTASFIEEALEEVDALREITTNSEAELATINGIGKELNIFRKAVAGIKPSDNKGVISVTSAGSIALDVADNIVRLSREVIAGMELSIEKHSRAILYTAKIYRRILGTSLVVFLLSTVIVVFFMDRALANPIRELADATRQVAGGDLSKEIKVRSGDEIGELSRSFNHMVSELRESKFMLVAGKDYIENVFQSLSDSIVIINEEGIITAVNSATLDMLERSRGELVNKPAGILFGEEEGEGDIRKIRYVLTSEKKMDNFITTYITKSKKEVQVMISGSLITDREGTGYDLIVAGKDITDRKMQEDELQSLVVQLEQSNNELQDFAHIASHDLQEPLRKIMAFGDRLKSKYEKALDEQGRDYLTRMRNASVRMQSLIQGLLMYSRVTSKAQPFVPVDLSAVLRDVLSDLELRIQETGGRVESDKLPLINADPLQMRQLLQNLIGNALKFNKPDNPPIITVSCKHLNGNGNGDGGHIPGKGMYEITISDNGIGFDEQYTDRIFGVFQRLHGRNDYEGSGIGLSICRKIVMRHGGRIIVKSAPGEGASFIIVLPIGKVSEEALDG